jgi:hypothetical protein
VQLEGLRKLKKKISDLIGGFSICLSNTGTIAGDTEKNRAVSRVDEK